MYIFLLIRTCLYIRHLQPSWTLLSERTSIGNTPRLVSYCYFHLVINYLHHCWCNKVTCVQVRLLYWGKQLPLVHGHSCNSCLPAGFMFKSNPHHSLPPVHILRQHYASWWLQRCLHWHFVSVSCWYPILINRDERFLFIALPFNCLIRGSHEKTIEVILTYFYCR